MLAQVEELTQQVMGLRSARRWWWVAASAAAMVLAVLLAWRPTAPVAHPTTPQEQTPGAVVERETDAAPAPEFDPSTAIAAAPAKREVTEVRFLWDGVQIVWLFDSHFKP